MKTRQPPLPDPTTSQQGNAIEALAPRTQGGPPGAREEAPEEEEQEKEESGSAGGAKGDNSSSDGGRDNDYPRPQGLPPWPRVLTAWGARESRIGCRALRRWDRSAGAGEFSRGSSST